MTLSRRTRLFTLLLLLVFVPLAIFCILQFSQYLTVRLHAEEIYLPVALLYGLGAVFALPCVSVLLLALPLSDAIENDTVFTKKTSRTLSLISAVMLCDCAGFFLAIVALLCVGEFVFAPILGIIDLLGISIAVLLRVLAGYIDRAALLQEEADATL